MLGPTDRLVSIRSIELRDAVTGGPPRLRTAVRVGFRDGALLVRFDGRDDGTVATLRRRDAPLWTEDVYEVFVTPVDPPVVYFEFEINPLGTLFDARVTSPDLVRATMSVDVGWNLAGLRASSRVRSGRWSVTLRIPLAPMLEILPPLPPGEGRGEGISNRQPTNWRANFYRVDRGEGDEFSAWSPTGKLPADFHEAGRFGRLRLPL
ncbi:MAG TPA: carbohydrate-binding family 9-like protein [Thermoanaerobaculia bacterium]|nr:carbohydrate-binding family 9-like protein [Thermoanaerobaculia bacterium]